MQAKIKDYEKLLKIVGIKRSQLEPALAALLRARAQILQQISDIDGRMAEAFLGHESGEPFDPLLMINLEKWGRQQRGCKDKLGHELAALDVEISKIRGLLLEVFKQNQHLEKMIREALQDQINVRDAATDEDLQMLAQL